MKPKDRIDVLRWRLSVNRPTKGTWIVAAGRAGSSRLLPFLPGSAVANTCFCSGRYWAATEALLGAREEPELGPLQSGFCGSQTYPSVVT